MLFKQAALGDERAFMTIKNMEASSITLGYAVNLMVGAASAASFDGTQALMTATGVAGNLPGFIGIAVKDIPTTQYGLVQCFGNCASVLISNRATSVTIATGDPLIPSAVPGALSSGVPTYAASGFNWVICSNATSNTLSLAAPAYVSGFIRCLK
jgi:hypothetical protein